MKKKKNSKKKIIIITSIIIIAAAIGIYMKKNGNATDKGTGFQYATVQRGNIENIVSSTGTLSALQTVEVGSQVSGIIENIYVDYNSTVKEGQVLAVLEKTLFKLSVKDAEASLIRAKAKLLQAQAELERNKPLYKKGHLSETEYLTFLTNAETARADLTNAETALKKARTNLEYTVIRSPINGTIIERTVDAGQTIAAAFQAPQLFLIARDLTQMQIETNVDESDIGQIKENMKVRFTVQSYPDKTFDGVVRQIRLQPTTIQNVVNYTVVVDAENNNRLLLPGMTATVDFLVEQKNNVLTIPNSAIDVKLPMEMVGKPQPPMGEKRKSGKNGKGRPAMGPPPQLTEGMVHAFYVDKAGKPRMTLVKTGSTDGINTEIVESKDLKEGMKVFTANKVSKKEKTNSGGGLFGPPPRRR